MVTRSADAARSAAWHTLLRTVPSASGLRRFALDGLRVVGVVLLLACPAGSAAQAGSIEALRQRIETLRAQGDPRIGAGSAAAREVLAAIYERRGFAPLWTDPQRLRRLRTAIDDSRTHGLDPRDYHAGILAGSPRDSEGARIERELLATDAFMRLAYHLYFGKADPRALQGRWNFPRSLDGLDPEAALASLIEAPDPGAALEALAPRLPSMRSKRCVSGSRHCVPRATP